MNSSHHHTHRAAIVTTLTASLVTASASLVLLAPAAQAAVVPQGTLTGNWNRIKATVTGSKMSRCAMGWALKATYDGGDHPVVWAPVTSGNARLTTPAVKPGDYTVTVMCSNNPTKDNEAEIPKLADGTLILGTIVNVGSPTAIVAPGWNRPRPYFGPRSKIPMISQLDPGTAHSHRLAPKQPSKHWPPRY